MVSVWRSERLCDINHHTITWKHSQEQTWQAWPWTHKFMSSKPVASQITMPWQTHLLWEVDQKLGHKSPPAQATLNESMMSYHLIKAKEKQCLTTLLKEDQVMTLLDIEKECLISRDEMKVMIACDHTQCIAVWQQDWTIEKSWMDCCPGWMR